MVKVTVGDFRSNLAGYLRLARYQGETVVIVDGKIGEPMAELVPPKSEARDEEYLKYVSGMFGAFKDLPKDSQRKRVKSAGVRKLRKLKANGT